MLNGAVAMLRFTTPTAHALLADHVTMVVMILLGAAGLLATTLVVAPVLVARRVRGTPAIAERLGATRIVAQLHSSPAA